jgi:antitoxin component YwqK of YwqJK toxin-antitoxin module
MRLANPQSRIPNRALRWLLPLCFAASLAWLWWPVRRHAVPLPTVSRTRLLLRNGRWYWRGRTNLFTGCMLRSYPNGGWLSRSAISNGVLNGLSEAWYTNGQMQVQECFKRGISNGLRRRWYENGKELSEANIVAGKIEGVFRRWHRNGRLAEQIPMKAGTPDGLAYEFYSSGFVKAQTRVRRGAILERKTWKDGQRQAASESLSAGACTVGPHRGGT